MSVQRSEKIHVKTIHTLHNLVKFQSPGECQVTFVVKPTIP